MYYSRLHTPHIASNTIMTFLKPTRKLIMSCGGGRGADMSDSIWMLQCSCNRGAEAPSLSSNFPILRRFTCLQDLNKSRLTWCLAPVQGWAGVELWALIWIVTAIADHNGAHRIICETWCFALYLSSATELWALLRCLYGTSKKKSWPKSLLCVSTMLGWS